MREHVRPILGSWLKIVAETALLVGLVGAVVAPVFFGAFFGGAWGAGLGVAGTVLLFLLLMATLEHFDA